MAYNIKILFSLQNNLNVIREKFFYFLKQALDKKTLFKQRNNFRG